MNLMPKEEVVPRAALQGKGYPIRRSGL